VPFGKTACDRIYEEKASAAKKERPELGRLLDHARKGDIIIVWRLDRLARSLRQLIETMDDLRQRGIELRSLQRTRAGLAAARNRGRVGGRPKSSAKMPKTSLPEGDVVSTMFSVLETRTRVALLVPP
jgi:DNA invertase Pin-like site-specific DNA recombinase